MLVNNQEKRTNWIEHRASRSEEKEDKKEWKDLWNIKIPSKVHHFLWRLAKQSIPTGDVRHHMKMAPTSRCSICGDQDSWRHSLLECNMARCVWVLQGEDLLSFINDTQLNDARGWLHEAVSKLQHDTLVHLVDVGHLVCKTESHP
jgi:hypothetical protein